jgi:hypothetical protein
MVYHESSVLIGYSSMVYSVIAHSREKQNDGDLIFARVNKNNGETSTFYFDIQMAFQYFY